MSGTERSGTATAPRRPLVGLMPAAGRARRLGHSPSSKELLPIGLHERGGALEPRPACLHLLDAYARAGVDRCLIVTRPEKTDLAAYLGALQPPPLPLGFVFLPDSGSVVETIARSHPFLDDCDVAFGFPDVLFAPDDAYARMASDLRASGADVVLGLFPTDRPERTDMVDVSAGGSVHRIEVRPAASDLAMNWLLAVWTPRFTRFLTAAFDDGPGGSADGRSELQLGSILAAAIDAELTVRGVPFKDGRYNDVGTPAELAEVWRRGIGAPAPTEESASDTKSR